MLRSITLLLLTSIFHHSFSQQKEFDLFIAELDSFRTIHTSIVYEDSLIPHTNYELKWTLIRGTYGGSQYGYEGTATKATSTSDTLFPIVESNLFYPATNVDARSSEIIGDQYGVETYVYLEPQPTSMQHFIYVMRYYVRKEN